MPRVPRTRSRLKHLDLSLSQRSLPFLSALNLLVPVSHPRNMVTKNLHPEKRTRSASPQRGIRIMRFPNLMVAVDADGRPLDVPHAKPQGSVLGVHDAAKLESLTLSCRCKFWCFFQVQFYLAAFYARLIMYHTQLQEPCTMQVDNFILWVLLFSNVLLVFHGIVGELVES